MKKFMRILVSSLLCLAMIFTMSSCDLVSELVGKFTDTPDDTIPDSEPADDVVNPQKPGEHTHSSRFPEGYTAGFGGDPCMFDTIGFYWLETYDEVLEAIELLESHGSQINSRFGFTCDGEPYDIKWCFKFEWRYAEELEEGKNFFDRKIDGGAFSCYIFRKDVTIDVLDYSYASFYDYLYVRTVDTNVNVEDPEQLSIDWWGREKYDITEPYEYDIMYADKKIANICFYNYPHQDFLTEDYFEILLDSLVVVG